MPILYFRRYIDPQLRGYVLNARKNRGKTHSSCNDLTLVQLDFSEMNGIKRLQFDTSSPHPSNTVPDDNLDTHIQASVMFPAAALFSFALFAIARGQQVGTLTAETHPALTVQKCAAGGSCTTTSASVVLDSNWRYLHVTSGSTNCYTGNEWDTSLCPDPATCAANCALDGADYVGTYGITTSGNALTLKFVTHGPFSTNIGSRVYLMASETEYQLFNLKNQEFTFDVDVSNLPCGLNGALYFTQMDADGGASRFPTNKAGAKYGTGYCDSQCPHDIKFINGQVWCSTVLLFSILLTFWIQANILDWTPSATDPNSGAGMFGTCCTEMDIWEANCEFVDITVFIIPVF